MRCLTLDPGASTGYALWVDKKLADCGARPHYDILYLEGEIDFVLAEMPQVYPQTPVNPNDIVTLAYRLGLCVGPLLKAGARIFLAKPREWKGQLPKDVCHARSRKKFSPDDALLVDSKLNKLNAKEKTDLLDAVALGQWGILHGHII